MFVVGPALIGLAVSFFRWDFLGDPRFVGLAEFSMSLDYEEVDGRPVATQRHAARDGRPSPWLLALHYGAAR